MTEIVSTSFTIPDDGDMHLATTTQFGMLFPDGGIQWDGMNLAPGRPIKFEALHKASDYRTTTWWDEYLLARAASAHLDVGQYRDQHQIVKRTVVLALTEAESA